MTTHYKVDGKTLRPFDPSADVTTTQLPAGVYAVGCDTNGFFVTQIDSFTLPSKIYGRSSQYAERIMNTFASRTQSTGVLLVGEKGSGKTLLIKQLGILAVKLGMPVLVINTPFRGDDFNMFIQNINQPAVVLFDEYEKVYNRDKQEELLTLFDGTYNSKKLFLLTSNSTYSINEYMRNRPGRLFYNIKFDKLDPQFIEEYCADSLKNPDHTASVLMVSKMFGSFNFDMLKALVEEMNRYNEDALTAIPLLNIKIEFESGQLYQATVMYNDKPLPKTVAPDASRISPYMPNFEYHEDVRADTTGWPSELIKEIAKITDLECEPTANTSFFVATARDKMVAMDIHSSTFVFNTHVPNMQLQFRRIERPTYNMAF